MGSQVAQTDLELLIFPSFPNCCDYMFASRKAVLVKSLGTKVLCPWPS